jgi:hypothetical protein
MTDEEIGALLRIERTARALMRVMGSEAKAMGATKRFQPFRQAGDLHRALNRLDQLRGPFRHTRVSPRADRG